MDRRAFIRTALAALPALLAPDLLAKSNPKTHPGKKARQIIKGIPVLLFHKLGASPQKPYCMTPAELEKVLRAAADGGFFPVGLDEIARGDLARVPAGKKPFAITLDDGHPSQIDLDGGKPDPRCAFAIIRRCFEDPRATFFVCPGKKRLPFGAEGEKKMRMVLEAGMSLGDHTAFHERMDKLGAGKITSGMGIVMTLLDKVLGEKRAAADIPFAYPYGVPPATAKLRDLVREFEYKGKTWRHSCAFLARLGFGEPMTKKTDLLFCPLPGTPALEERRYLLPRINISSLKDFKKDVLERDEIFIA